MSTRIPLRATLLEHSLVCERCRPALERVLLKEEKAVVQHALDEGVLPPGRRQVELQQAHDRLAEVFQDRALRARLFPNPDIEGQAAMALDTLCWALNHTHLSDRRSGANFGRLLIDLEIAEPEGAYLRNILPRKPPAAEPPKKRKPPEPALLQKGPPVSYGFDFGKED